MVDSDGLPIGTYYVEEDPGSFIEDATHITVIKPVTEANGDHKPEFPRYMRIRDVVVIAHGRTSRVVMRARLAATAQEIVVTWQDGPVGYGYGTMEVQSDPRKG